MLKIDLDDEGSTSKLDASSMLGALDQFPDSLHQRNYEIEGLNIGQSRISNLVLMGMGGSASSGDVVSNWLRNDLEIPVSVQREPDLHGSVNSKTLFVGVSYSGETVETLKAVRAARERRAKIVGIGTGGELKILCAKFRSPFVRVNPSIAPRAALSQLVVATSMVLEEAGLVGRVSAELDRAWRELRPVMQSSRIKTQLTKNPAKKLAKSLFGHFIVLYSMQRMSSVARRFKNQLAENSKEVAKYDLLPESCHNEIEAWAGRRRDSKPLIIRDSEESRFDRSIIEAFRSTIAGASRTQPVEVKVPCNGVLSRLLCPILLLDYASVYLALLKGIDPTPTKLIEKYKRAVTL